MKHVLLIAYYWPPSSGAGVHRWLRFSKYFTENNCKLTVYCPKDAAWPVTDENLNKEVPKDVTVIRKKVFEPHKYLGNAGGVSNSFTEEKKPSPIKKAIVWIRGNLFIPDSRRFWIKPSARYLNAYLKEHPEIDTIISSGPPHSMHLIAQRLKKKNDIKWIADFRDPWTDIDFYHELMLGERADAKHKKLEKAVLVEADEVITVSRTCAEGLESIGNRKVHIVTNGYEFPEFNPADITLDKKFTISHFGSMPFARNPLVLWKALHSLLTTNEALKSALEIHLVGTVDFKILDSLKSYGLTDFVITTASIPHKESIERQRKTQLLLLIANNTGNVKGILTGKFFEYLGAKRPIIAIGMKDSDLEAAIANTACGEFVDYEAVDKMKAYILQSFHAYQEGKLNSESKNVNQYHSKNLVKEIIALLK